MAVLKNVQFTTLIKAGGRLREFNFRKSNSLTGPLYHVDVPDERDNRYYLLYVLENGHWQWQESSLPPWLMDALPLIQEALEKEQ